MSDVTIRIRDNGPILVEGPVTLLDADGNPYPLDPQASVCAVSLRRLEESPLL